MSTEGLDDRANEEAAAAPSSAKEAVVAASATARVALSPPLLTDEDETNYLMIHSIAHKKMLFIPMKDWEDERIARCSRFLLLLDPVVTTLAKTAADSLAVLTHTSLFLQQRARVDMDYAKLLRSCCSITGSEIGPLMPPSSTTSCPSINTILHSNAAGSSAMSSSSSVSLPAQISFDDTPGVSAIGLSSPAPNCFTSNSESLWDPGFQPISVPISEGTSEDVMDHRREWDHTSNHFFPSTHRQARTSPSFGSAIPKFSSNSSSLSGPRVPSPSVKKDEIFMPPQPHGGFKANLVSSLTTSTAGTAGPDSLAKSTLSRPNDDSSLYTPSSPSCPFPSATPSTAQPSSSEPPSSSFSSPASPPSSSSPLDPSSFSSPSSATYSSTCSIRSSSSTALTSSITASALSPSVTLSSSTSPPTLPLPSPTSPSPLSSTPSSSSSTGFHTSFATRSSSFSDVSPSSSPSSNVSSASLSFPSKAKRKGWKWRRSSGVPVPTSLSSKSSLSFTSPPSTAAFPPSTCPDTPQHEDDTKVTFHSSSLSYRGNSDECEEMKIKNDDPGSLARSIVELEQTSEGGNDEKNLNIDKMVLETPISTSLQSPLRHAALYQHNSCSVSSAGEECGSAEDRRSNAYACGTVSENPSLWPSPYTPEFSPSEIEMYEKSWSGQQRLPQHQMPQLPQEVQQQELRQQYPPIRDGSESNYRCIQSILFPRMASLPWLLALIDLNEQTAAQLNAMGSFTDGTIVQMYLMKACTEYQRISSLLLDAIQKARSHFMRVAEHCKLAWANNEAAFKIATKTLDIGGKHRGRSSKKQCCWLLERKYIAVRVSTVVFSILLRELSGTSRGQFTALFQSYLSFIFSKALEVQAAQRLYFKILVKNIVELQRLERWRFETLRQMLQSFSTKLKSSFSVAQLVLDSIRNTLHNSDSIKNEEMDERQNRRSIILTHLGSGNYYYRKLARDQVIFMDSATVELSRDAIPEGTIFDTSQDAKEGRKYKYLSDAQTDFVASLTKPAVNRDFLLEKYSFFDQLTKELDMTEGEHPNFLNNHLFSQAIQQLEYPAVPETHLVIKNGPVKRVSGMGVFQKWSSGFLVVTWDRFLHMFRGPKEPNPLWTICLASFEVKSNDKQKEEGEAVIELREKKKTFIVAGRSFYLKPYTNTDFQEWNTLLRMVTDVHAFYSAVSGKPCGMDSVQHSAVQIGVESNKWSVPDGMKEISYPSHKSGTDECDDETLSIDDEPVSTENGCIFAETLPHRPINPFDDDDRDPCDTFPSFLTTLSDISINYSKVLSF